LESYSQISTVDELENVQRQFTKCITSISHLIYHERLSIIDLESLELRRLRFDFIQYYKILNNLTPLKYAKYFTYHQPSSSSRKPSTFLIKPINSPNCLLSSFFNRSVDCWNSLPQTLKEVNSLDTFMVDLSSFLIGSAFDIS